MQSSDTLSCFFGGCGTFCHDLMLSIVLGPDALIHDTLMTCTNNGSLKQQGRVEKGDVDFSQSLVFVVL